MLSNSELEFCKAYHLSQSKDLGDISNTLMWSMGKVLEYKRRCEDRGWVVDNTVTPLTLANIRTIEELKIKGL